MKVKIGILALITLVILTACADLDREEQLKKVDHLHKQIDSLEVALQEHRIDTLANIQNTLISLENRIRNNYTADTIDVSLVQKMQKFRKLKQFFMPNNEEEEERETEGLNHQTLESAYLIVKRGIISEKSMLQKLKSDISNGFGKRDKYNEYIAFESEKVKQLRALLEDYKLHKDKILADFKVVQTDLNSYATTLEKENKTRLKR